MDAITLHALSIGRMFAASEPFKAYSDCVARLHELGFSVAPMQHHSPTAVMFGRDLRIQKYRNLSPSDKDNTHGWIEGDFRSGPVHFKLTAAGRRAVAPKEMAT